MGADIQIYDTFSTAQQAANDEAMATRGTAIPGALYEQGGRMMVSTSLAMHEVIRLVRLDSYNAKKGGNPSESRNRPLIPEHVRSISDYLTSEEQYILPPVTLNIDKPLKCFTSSTRAPVRNVVVIVPRGYQFYVTDGQHRIKAIENAIEIRPELQDDAISVNLVLEQEMVKVHQDFADCAQTKEIPKSLLAVFDTRSKLYPLLQRMTKEVDLFRGRIDEAAQSIGKTSIKLFTLNQIRFCAAEILLGNSIQNREQLAKHVAERLDGPAGEQHIRNIVDFYQRFTQYNDIWTLIANSNAKPGPEENSIPKLREDNVHLTATGLQVISRVGNSINTREEEERDEFIRRLATLDYGRRSPIWLDNIVSKGTWKINTTNFPVKVAVRNVKLAIGLELTDAEKNLEKKEKETSNDEQMPKLF